MKAKKIHLLTIILVFLFILPELSLGQGTNFFNVIGAGARARGMGGAFIGVADDATAASWNPAGLVFLEKPEASAVYVYSSVFQIVDDEEVEDLGLSHGYFNFGSVAIPLSLGEINLVGCVAYQRMIDNFNKGEKVLFDDYNNPYYYDTHTKGGVDAISPSLGIQLSPQLSIGLACNIYLGKTVINWESLNTETDVDSPDETYSGLNFVLGGMLDLGMFRIGGVFKTPFTLKSERDEILDRSGINFFGYEYEMKMPAMIGIGAMIEPVPNLRFSVDYELRGFSNSEDRTTWKSTVRSNLDNNEFESLEYEDVNQLRLGAEYLLMLGDIIIPLRAGFKTEPQPYKDYNDDQVVGAGITLGIGLATKSFSLDATMEYSALTLETTTFDMNTYNWRDSEVTNGQINIIISGIFYFGN